MFHTMVFLTLMMAPVITMGLLAQERNLGTIETLMTRPVRDAEVVVGKYLRRPRPVPDHDRRQLRVPADLRRFGAPDWGQILSGYIGVILAGMAFLAIGVFTSSLTSNQIAAAPGPFLLLVFWLIGWIAKSARLGDVAKSLSSTRTSSDLEKGIIDTKHIIFFATLIGFFLFLTMRSLETRRA